MSTVAFPYHEPRRMETGGAMRHPLMFLLYLWRGNMLRWWEWFRCVQALRPACARHRTFLWMSLVLAGVSIRADLAGVSSVVRTLGLRASYYRRLLYVCHAPGVRLALLSACWARLVMKIFTPFRLGGR